MKNNIERNIQTAVVTGPTGAIGIALCEKLLRENVTVYAVCRPGSSRIKDLPKAAALHVVECDAKELATLPQKMEGVSVDAFFHFAWAHTIGQGRNDMPAQIENIQSTIEIGRAHV